MQNCLKILIETSLSDMHKENVVFGMEQMKVVEYKLNKMAIF